MDVLNVNGGNARATREERGRAGRKDRPAKTHRRAFQHRHPKTKSKHGQQS
jgi:hypothetical protein